MFYVRFIHTKTMDICCKTINLGEGRCPPSAPDQLRCPVVQPALMSSMDKLNQQGRGTLYFAGQGIQQSWQMKREMLSPCYSTQLADVPTARA
ncbi:Error-prone, lesion bypass DNA polymerase V (UmuC) [Cronobacter dublinensis 582]|nr:Error-prone, lesion bypass DNA polymerase V (UmuC) [Cronobacter dublinensis 582]